MPDIKEHMFQVPLSSHRTLHLQIEKTNLNHSVHLHAASAGWFGIKINMQIGAGGCGDRQGEPVSAGKGCSGMQEPLTEPPQGQRQLLGANANTKGIYCFCRLLLLTLGLVKAI